MSRALEQALEWQVLLWSGEVTRTEYEAFEEWLQQSTLHQAAWDRLQRVNSTFDSVSTEVAKQILPKDIDHSRRRLLYSVTLLSGLGFIGYHAPKTALWQAATADFHTFRGERLSIQLKDGTALTLNTDTALMQEFNSTKRQLRLKRGEIEIATGHDTNPTPRPFLVSTSVGSVRPIGTRFIVRQLEDAKQSVLVSVSEGAVELEPLSGGKTLITAGKKAIFDQSSVHSLTPSDHKDRAWTKGLFVVEQQPLKNFIKELQRYRTGTIRIEPAIESLTVTGVFPLNDPEEILQTLEEILPIQRVALSKYWITLKQK